jgi:hypothetical protein
MGNEFAQGREWRAGSELDWGLLGIDWHRGVQTMMRDLCRLYRDEPALHELDFEPEGFRWIDCNDSDQSILCFERRARNGSPVVVALNFTPVPRHGYRVGLPKAGAWREVFNSDSAFYAGSNSAMPVSSLRNPFPGWGTTNPPTSPCLRWGAHPAVRSAVNSVPTGYRLCHKYRARGHVIYIHDEKWLSPRNSRSCSRLPKSRH